MIKILLLVIATASLANCQNSYFSKMWPFGQNSKDDNSNGYNSNNDNNNNNNDYNSYTIRHDDRHYDDHQCPSLRGARNNDFEKADGLWFKIQEVPSDSLPTVCSITVYQRTSPYSNKLILRNPRMNQKHHDRDDVETGDSKKLDESSWLTEMDQSDEKWLATVLSSDQHKGNQLLHVCNVKNPKEQRAYIMSRNRHLDQKTIDKMHQVLIKSGLKNLEEQLKDVEQEHCQSY